jgi:hypothetical protein
MEETLLPGEIMGGNEGGNDGNGNTIKLSLSQVVMFIGIIITLASGWTILKMDQEAMRVQMDRFATAQAAMASEISQLRDDLIHYGITRSGMRQRDSSQQRDSQENSK